MTLEPGRSPLQRLPGRGRGEALLVPHPGVGPIHARGRLLAQCGDDPGLGPDPGKSNFPWDQEHLAMAKLFAGEAKAEGMAYGAYTVSFRVEGDFEKAPYTFTTAYEHAGDRLVSPRFVSMTDPRRERDLVKILKDLDGIDGVTWLGLDYVRSNNGGLELTDEFLSDMGFYVSPELKAASLRDRQMWLGRILNTDKDIQLDSLWNWYKSHRMCQVVNQILTESAVKKPVWMFLLGWKQGHQHGQDPFMFHDCGVSLVAPMFYELDPVEFETMLEDWKTYLGRGAGTFVFGEPVDTPLLHNFRNLNGPEEMYLRNIETLGALKGLTENMGFFWHDINRALAGGRGPDPMREWVISGASAFSRLREASGTVPVHVEILDNPAITPLGVSFKIRVTNLSSEKIPLLRLDGVHTPGISEYQPAFLDVPALKGFESRELTWVGLWGVRQLKEKYQTGAPEIRMLAVRGRVLGNPKWKLPDFAFKYVGERGIIPMGPAISIK